MGQAVLFSLRVDESVDRLDNPVQVGVGLYLFRSAIDGLADGIAVTASSEESELPLVFYANPAFLALTGCTPADFSPPRQGESSLAPFSSPPDHPFWRTLNESHRSEDVFFIDLTVRDASGCGRVLRLRSDPIRDQLGQITHRVATLRDITRETDVEEVLLRNERLACIGLLAAGIAHEINNPTGSALLAAETALAIMDSPDADRHVAACLRNIVTSMDRCGRIVRTLLRYSREESADKQACSVNDVAKQATELARPYSERYGAALHLELDPDVPLAPMNPLEIELVLVNLIRNAVEAGMGSGEGVDLARSASAPAGPAPLPQAAGGVAITIRTSRTDDGVRVTVSDNGCGMDKEQLAHVFDPLYTTRRRVGGSGLGMSIAYGIVKGHEGRMEAQSQPGTGTTVTIDLPSAVG